MHATGGDNYYLKVYTVARSYRRTIQRNCVNDWFIQSLSTTANSICGRKQLEHQQEGAINCASSTRAAHAVAATLAAIRLAHVLHLLLAFTCILKNSCATRKPSRET